MVERDGGSDRNTRIERGVEVGRDGGRNVFFSSQPYYIMNYNSIKNEQ